MNEVLALKNKTIARLIKLENTPLSFVEILRTQISTCTQELEDGITTLSTTLDLALVDNAKYAYSLEIGA
ncbi:MAG: hypothetical protein WA667_04155 [Candidatus Nitrosopolaris sp.]